MGSGVQSIEDINRLEGIINSLLQQYSLDEVIVGLRQSQQKLLPFTIAGISLFAIRFALPPIARKDNATGIEWDNLRQIAHFVMQYLLADPVSFTPPAENTYHDSTAVPILLRTIGNQFPYDFTIWGQYGRSQILYHDLLQQLTRRTDIPQFDIESAFQKIAHIPLMDYIDVGFVAFVAAQAEIAFTGWYFQKARHQGIALPDDEAIALVLDQLAADQWQMRALYDQYRQRDHRYAAYDFNPLFVHPIIRPWKKRDGTSLDDDRLIAPLPNLIIAKLSEGIYRHMFHKYRGEFASYFGHLFEAYVGVVLSHSLRTTKLLSGSDIKQRYKAGKIPDWVVVDGNTAVVIECKATGLPRKAFATADKDAIDQGLAAVVDGLVQLYEFDKMCQNRSKGLESLHGCSKFYHVVVTHEPLYIANSSFLTDVIKQKFIERVPDADLTFSWVILVVDELERFQPHMAAGIRLTDIIERIGSQSFNEVLTWCQQQSGKTYHDSFLYAYDEELYRRLNVPNNAE